MKKLFVCIVISALFSIVSSNLAYAGYRVSGAGVAGADGLYCETGDYSEGRPVYQKSGSSWQIWYSSAYGGYWWIDDAQGTGPGSTYFHEFDTQTPPTEGWNSNKGFAPAPDLSEESCTAIPSINELGLAVLSLLMAGAAFWFIRRKGKTV